MTTIRKAGTDEQETPDPINVDLSNEPISSAKDWIEVADHKRNLVKENNAGTIAKIIVVTIGSLLIAPLVIAGLITVFKSAQEAQAYAAIVGTLLKSMGEFISAAFNVLPWILVYYFLQKDRSQK